MEPSNLKDELKEGELLTEERCKIVDLLYFSPSERASHVHTLFTFLTKEGDFDSPTAWDMICFAVEYIGMQAIALQIDELIELVKDLNNYIYSLHYSNPAEMCGPPDKLPEKEDETVHEEGPEVSEGEQSRSVPRSIGDHGKSSQTDGNS